MRFPPTCAYAKRGTGCAKGTEALSPSCGIRRDAASGAGNHIGMGMPQDGSGFACFGAVTTPPKPLNSESTSCASCAFLNPPVPHDVETLFFVFRPAVTRLPLLHAVLPGHCRPGAAAPHGKAVGASRAALPHLVRSPHVFLPQILWNMHMWGAERSRKFGARPPQVRVQGVASSRRSFTHRRMSIIPENLPRGPFPW